MKLFIIGNGFDIDHGLKTQYINFKEYLEEYYCFYGNYQYRTYVNEDSLIYEAASFIYEVINSTAGENWCNLEHALGEIDYSELYDKINFDNSDKDINNTIWNNQERMDFYYCLLENLEMLFKEWIEHSLKKEVFLQSKYLKLFSKDSLFLTFNYTDILERIYNISSYNICHIHGKISGKIIFGHVNENRILQNTSTIGIDDTIESIHKLLFKNCDESIKKNINFFNKMTEVDDIYILGWSISDEDSVYLKKIQSIIGNREVTIHFTQYDRKNNSDLCEKINKIQIFNILSIDYI